MKGTFFAFFAIALFSLYAVFGKLLVENVNPILILIINQVFAGLIIVLVMDVLKKLREFKATKKNDYKLMLIISLFSALAGPLLFLSGLSLTSATNSVLIAKSEAVLTALIAIFLLKDKITLHQIIGTVVMFFGVMIIATNGFVSGFQLQLGDILIFLSAIVYSIGTVLFKKYMDHIPPEIIVSLRSLYGASILFILSLSLIDFSQVQMILSGKIILAFLGLAVFTTALGQYLWYKALELTSATNVSLAGLSSPLIAIIYTTLLLGEKLVLSQIVGGLIILIGLVLLEVHFKKIHPSKIHKRHLKLRHLFHI